MREILFKGKRIDNGEWVEGMPIHNHIGTFMCFDENPHYCHQYGYMEIDKIIQVEPETVCQLTGLTDKNRTEIFEGDIVSFRHSKPDFDIKSEYPFFPSKEYNRNYVIEFSNTTTHYGLRFKNGSITFPCKQGILFNGDCKVIGNIFDNPELLKEGVE